MATPAKREAWLAEMTDQLRPHFTDQGYTIPDNVRVSCGFPSQSALSRKARRIGECWSNQCSGDETFEIFISPTLEDSMRVAGVLAHELIHATVGLACGHKGPFRKCALAIGLEGKMTATTESEAFKRDVQPMIDALGDYPHATLMARSGAKKQSTRLIKCQCLDCGYTVRTTRKYLEFGTPICPLDEIPMEEC
jgi:hypothetical protein|tara:strand:+ start:218 stop:799 length:582 start_codon:yes stop_codon:yes gene_type:complete